jgi:hypothetical protein
VSVIVGAVETLLWSPGGAGAATLAVRLPDGTTLAPAPTVTGDASSYTADLPTTQPGRHQLAWTRGGLLVVDVLDVWPADPRYIISVDDALDACQLKGAAAGLARPLLPLYVAAATYVVESMTGPLLVAQRTKVADGGREAINLPAAPVQVVSVTVSGTVLASADFIADEDAGIVYAAGARFSSGRANVVVVYTVGASMLPANAALAAGIIIKQMWQADQQGYRPAFGSPDSGMAMTPAGFLVPKRAFELLAATPNVPGFA